MNFIEAAKKSDYVRRPIAKHLGSNGDGWIDARFAFDQGRYTVQYPFPWYKQTLLLTWNDLMADDWEAKINYGE